MLKIFVPVATLLSIAALMSWERLPTRSPADAAPLPARPVAMRATVLVPFEAQLCEGTPPH